jgi:DNA-binding transcriptional regulator YhcF (GntR family)
MQLWLAREGEVTIREQLVTQVVLGILSDELVPGQRLPSTRELARRFRLHPNTVSAGYRQLERDRWVEFRRGSGVYVNNRKPEVAPSAALAVDQLIGSLFRSARKLEIPLGMLRSRLRQWLELQPPFRFLLIEPDEELRRIAAAEIQRVVTFPVKSCGIEECKLPETVEGAIPLAFPSKLAAVRQALPSGSELLSLHVRSVPASLAGWLPAPAGTLVGITSRWPDFLKVARTILTAAGFHPDSMVFRDARKPGWQRGLKQTAAVVCDSVSAAALPKGCRAIVFPVLAESSIVELRRYEAFVRNPLSVSL